MQAQSRIIDEIAKHPAVILLDRSDGEFFMVDVHTFWLEMTLRHPDREKLYPEVKVNWG